MKKISTNKTSSKDCALLPRYIASLTAGTAKGLKNSNLFVQKQFTHTLTHEKVNMDMWKFK